MTHTLSLHTHTLSVKKQSVKKQSVFIATTLISLLVATQAFSQVKIYDWPDAEAPVLITTPGSAIFMHKDGRPLRAYSWKTSNAKGDPKLFVTDIDRDGKPDIVGPGKPTFAISSNTTPLWFQPKGCQSVVLGDFAADHKLDIACINKREVKLYSHDNQFMWSADVGRRIKRCVGGDLNGDQKADLECTVHGSKKFAHIDGEGQVLTLAGEKSSIGDAYAFEAFATAKKDTFDGSTLYDLNKDGTAEEFFKVDGTLMHIVSKTNPRAIVSFNLKSKPLGVLVKDLDGDGTLEVVAISAKKIVVARPSTKTSQTYPLRAKSYKRKPLAKLHTVYANNFKDDTKAKASIDTVKKKLSKCYSGRAKKGGFTGSGKLMVQINVDDKGKVHNVLKVHSEIADKAVVTCALRTLKKIKPTAATHGERGVINATIVFSFRDLP